MTSNLIQEYLRIVFDMEKNVYIQKTTISMLQNKADSMGIKKKYSTPECREAYGNGDLLIACLVGLAVFFIIFIPKLIGLGDNFGWSFSDIFDTIFSAFATIIIGTIAGLIVGAITYAITVAVSKSSEQKKFDREYRAALREYDNSVKSDNLRVKKENIQKQIICSQIEELSVKYKESKRALKNLYAYNILWTKYHFDIVAVSSFYEYFVSGRTKSLTFNEVTGDQGAYNIYENEKRLGQIITNTEIIINKIDQIAENQRELAEAIYQANRKINSLNSNVEKISKDLNSLDDIKKNSEITAYNSERTKIELEYKNKMDDIYRNRYH